MELYQLRGFTVVAEQGQLTRAADKLHVSQPALSAQIKALEDELGVELFDRVSSGMVLTAPGRRLLPFAQAVIVAVQALRSQARSLVGEVAGRVRLGTLADPEFLRLPRILAGAMEHYPMLEIEVHQGMSGEAFEAVRDGALDAAFYYGDLTHPAVASIALREFSFRVVIPAAWRGRLESVAFELLAQEPWIVTPAISSHRALTDRLFHDHGVAPAATIEANNEAVIRSLVTAGLGVALVREDIAAELIAEGAVFPWEGVVLWASLQFITPAARRGDPVLQALLGLLAEAWPEAAIPGSAAGES
jgi:DNA-binding transcriptional LysR family regulator